MELAELIEQIDIVEYISQYVDLEAKGEEFWGLSPFKEEKTPSFSVRRESHAFCDFSSGLAGNVFTFTKRYFNCGSYKAVQILKDYAGVTDDVAQRHIRLEATGECKKYAPLHKREKEYIAKPLSKDHMERYEIKPEKLQIWRDEGISDESMERFCVRYDAFSNRIVYPIRDLQGNIVNIGGRALTPDWKARGERKYTYFYKWGTIQTIYGLAENMQEIKKQNEVILFEGCKSVLKADSWGIKNTGAILTSHLSHAQMEILIKLGVRVVFALDKDVKIRDDRNIAKLRNYTFVQTLYDRSGLLDDKDAPVDKGEAVFRTLYEERRRFK